MASEKSRIFQQIEAKADYYPPSTYADLLSFYNDFFVGRDQASGEFIPFTQARHTRKDHLLFAIGIIPPAANVTGRLLDRTASVPVDGAVEPVGEEAVNQAKSSGAAGTDAVSGNGGRNRLAHKAARSILTDAFKKVMGREPTLAEIQYAHAIAVLETNYGQGWKKGSPMEGSNNWGAVQCSSAKQGTNSPDCISFFDSYPDGRTYPISFRKYDTPQDGAADLINNIFIKRSTSQALEDGDVMRASYEMRRGFYFGGFCPDATKQFGSQAARDSFRSPDKNEGTKACAEETIKAHAKLAKSIIDEVAAANNDPSAVGLGTYDAADSWWRAVKAPDAGGPVEGDAHSGNWANGGNKNAADAKKQEEKLAGSPMLSSQLGQALLKAQLAQIKATQDAIAKMAQTPPLAMLINPASFSVKGEKIVNDGNWGRNGPIIEYWGDQQDKISGSGKVGGFFALDALNANGPGLTRWARNFSLAWQTFQSLYHLYRSNGALFLPDDITYGTTVNLSMVGSIYIFYDNVLYIGSFDTLTITENDTTPFTVDYSFDFTVRASFLLDRLDEQLTYGAPSSLRTNAPATNLNGIPVQSTPPQPRKP